MENDPLIHLLPNLMAAEKESAIAYQFVGNSYTHGAMQKSAHAVWSIEQLLNRRGVAAEGFCESVERP